MRRSLLILGLALGGAWFPACSTPDSRDTAVAAGSASAAPASKPIAPAPATPAPRTSRPEVVFLGDSLTAGLGLSTELSFPALIQQRIDAAGLDFTVANAGVSGDTSAGGLRRLEWSLQGQPRVLVVALGGNDGLRGLDPAELQKNLAAIIERGQQAGLRVILAGMEAPPNNGPDYTTRFRQVYPDRADLRRAADPVPARRRRRRPCAQSGRRDSPQPRGCTAGGRYRLEGAGAGAPGHEPTLMIALRDVSKTVQSGSVPLTILHPLSLDVPDGQCLAIVGPSGSGKSTLLGLIAGLDAPTSGEIRIDGVEITSLDEDALARLRGEKIGFVFQFFHLVPSLTALENIQVPMEIAGRADAPREPRRCSTRWACTTAVITIRRSCRAASSSASRSPARWPTIRRSCSPTSRPAISTAPTAGTSSICCCRYAGRGRSRWSSSRTT